MSGKNKIKKSAVRTSRHLPRDPIFFLATLRHVPPKREIFEKKPEISFVLEAHPPHPYHLLCFILFPVCCDIAASEKALVAV